jgi:CheY-like chemotaxis protein
MVSARTLNSFRKRSQHCSCYLKGMHVEKIRILVVDDQPQLARVVRLILEESGRYEVQIETRPDFVPASARNYRPAVILLDVDMPDKNGAEVARDLWRAADLRNIPILFFTGLVPINEAGQRDTAHGARRFVSKLAQPAQLFAAIEEVLAMGTHPSTVPLPEVPHPRCEELTTLCAAHARPRSAAFCFSSQMQ